MYIDKDDNKEYKILGICAAGVNFENVRNIVSAVCRAAEARGFRIFIFNPFSDLYNDTAYSKGEGSIFRLINPRLIDALVILPESIKNDKVVEAVIKGADGEGLPVFVIDRIIDGCVSFPFSYEDSFELIVDHIFSHHGCRRVNFIAGIKDNEFSQIRENLYRSALEKYGIPFEQERVGYGDFWEKPTVKVVEDFIKSDLPFPEAIICCNDTTAITACRVLRNHGYNVPDDVLVTGFDGIEHEKYVSPRLTTAAADLERLGVEVMSAVEASLSGKKPPKVIEIPYSVRFSQSCGCKPQNKEAIGDMITELYGKINDSQGHESFMFSYLADTVECKTSDELARVIAAHADTFSWCIINSDFLGEKPEEERYHEVYTKKMTALMMREGGEFYTNIEFPVEDMLPFLPSALKSFTRIMFSPMHFQDQIIGYMAISVSNDNFDFQNARRFINMTNQIMESYKSRLRLEKANAELAQMHMRDPMTGIYNRRGFYHYVKKLFGQNSGSEDVVIFSIDMDGLKPINDTYGHTEGDRAIKAVSAALEKSSVNSEIYSRFGGDEFVVFSMDTREYYIEDYIAAVNKAIDEFNETSGAPYKVRISCGAVKAKIKTLEQLDDFIKLADMRMYEQKRVHKQVADDGDDY